WRATATNSFRASGIVSESSVTIRNPKKADTVTEVFLCTQNNKPKVMGNRLYVGNLPFNTTETDLQDLFAQAGPVNEVVLMQDKFTGKSRGFAFVTMATDADAQSAITQFHGKAFEGRP